jgi:alpha-aminoadipate carrier protein LysW
LLAALCSLQHSPLDLRLGKNLNIRSGYLRMASKGSGGIMVLCPECETNLDVEEEEVDEGEIVSCPECGTDFEVVTTSPLELKAVEAGYVEEEEEVESEDGDDS